MLLKTLSVLGWIVLIVATSVGQSSFQEITPGSSTRNDVTRAFGQPVRTISATRFEYNPPDGIARVEVEYAAGSSLVELMEVHFLRPVSRSGLVKKFGLEEPVETSDAEGKLVEYFGDSWLLSLTYVSADAASGVSSVGYYSRELFEAKFPRGTAGANNNPNNQQPLLPSGPKYEDVIASARVALQARDFQNALSLGQQAVALDPARPDAYEIVGITQLYGMGNAGAAEPAYRAALERSGRASFTALHDHDGFFQSFCQGTFAMSRFGVAFYTSNGIHQFDITYKDVREMGVNKLVGAKSRVISHQSGRERQL